MLIDHDESGDWGEAHRLELLLDSINREYKRAFAARLRSTSLTSEQAIAVAALTYYGPLTQRELSEVLDRHKAAISSLINNLEREQFVARTVNPDDNRSNVVSLLPRGMEAFATVDGLVTELRQQLTRGLSSAEYVELVRMLKCVRVNLQDVAELRTTNQPQRLTE